jgi:tRNA modification GTPase
MLLRTQDTIVAVASPPGGGLRGIVRLSGPQAVTLASAWFREAGTLHLDGVRRPMAIAGEAILNERGDRLPGELYVWPGQRSYTHQPTVEFHTLGSPPLLNLLVQAICAHGARAAEPGEFTLRAFLAGRLDLTQAEAVLGVIDASSRTELDVALRQLGGGLAAPISRLRDELLDALAHLEAGLDFVEEDIEFIGRDALRQQLVAARGEVVALAARMSARASAANEYRVVLYGRPNVGKSSLLNSLARSQQAIVSDVAGTTRDYITASIDCGGVHCQFVDTAGHTAAVADGIGSAAEGAAAQQSQAAHLRLLCLDATRPLDDWERAEAGRADPQRLVVHTKCDAAASSNANCRGMTTSSISGLGLDQLKRAIGDRLMQLVGTQGDVVAGTAARCRDSLERALGSLDAALAAVDQDVGEEFVASEIRLALEALGRIAGAVYTDDILDRIFSRFCIGK